MNERTTVCCLLSYENLYTDNVLQAFTYFFWSTVNLLDKRKMSCSESERTERTPVNYSLKTKNERLS